MVLLVPDQTVDERLLLLLEQILEDEQTPSAAACVNQRATFVELSQLDGREPELFGQGRPVALNAAMTPSDVGWPASIILSRFAARGCIYIYQGGSRC